MKLCKKQKFLAGRLQPTIVARNDVIAKKIAGGLFQNLCGRPEDWTVNGPCHLYTAVKCRVFFGCKPDWIKYLGYQIRIGLDYTTEILDWIRIAKISDPFNITTYARHWQVQGPMQDLGAGPSEQWFYDLIVFRQPCCTTMVERRYKDLPQESSTFDNVRQ